MNHVHIAVLRRTYDRVTSSRLYFRLLEIQASAVHSVRRRRTKLSKSSRSGAEASQRCMYELVAQRTDILLKSNTTDFWKLRLIRYLGNTPGASRTPITPNNAAHRTPVTRRLLLSHFPGTPPRIQAIFRCSIIEWSRNVLRFVHCVIRGQGERSHGYLVSSPLTGPISSLD